MRVLDAARDLEAVVEHRLLGPLLPRLHAEGEECFRDRDDVVAHLVQPVVRAHVAEQLGHLENDLGEARALGRLGRPALRDQLADLLDRVGRLLRQARALPLHDHIGNRVRLDFGKGDDAGDQFVEGDPKAEDVHLLEVPLFHEYFRCRVLHGAVVPRDPFGIQLCAAEIDDPDQVVPPNHQVSWFQVQVCKPHRVQVVHPS